ncbi:MAG: von Willebrand factor type A domain-containing protein [Gemmatimonadetes bacterium]|nr:von Willebrand factor type A domain-containing protein [Gemmatimonadota bacterium]MBK6779292.1 von Willebrand factor type A domain-containing protein [Gemmatimonadota bacterium]MBK7713965.1 von Willebrand factor type A domain-containing protein [Gemmatimonadota bacterium]MBK7923966.1 von Willebrand factor type A domain-containing protein [Gemmatimonadota bacterium]MBK9692760.1 von Willebrand factor type A domain-containing protein [Gemmatimonadota bacterium]
MHAFQAGRWFPGILALGLGLVAPVVPPGPMGTVAGTVVDGAGDPIPGAQVQLDPGARGAVADPAGRYRIDSVAPGTYDLRACFVGYRPMLVRGLRVAADSATIQDVTLEQSPIELQEITVVSAMNALIPRDAVSTRQNITGEYAGALPTERISGALALQPGISVRSGRADESAAYVDGVPVQGGHRGGQFIGGVDVSTGGFEQASVTPGGTAAEFGNAQPGVIGMGGAGTARTTPATPGSEEYSRIVEHRFRDPVAEPLSTFSIDVDAASYTNVRRFLTEGMLPPPDAVRIEEMVNYFPYDYPAPAGRHPFTVTLEQGACPWNEAHRLLLVGLQGRRLDLDQLPPSNLVFLLDVSGSMDSPDKLPLVQQAFRLLVQQLRPRDRVAIVVYAGAAGLVLPSTPGSAKGTILAAIDRLEAGGSTAGGAGIQLAYQVATEQFQRGGNNRVILATDGDFNVGVSSEAELVRLIEEKRESGVFLTVLGFGTGNLKDARMEQLADQGNGHYAYVDNLREARRVFVSELGGTLHTIAKDVKLQLEFNPARVAGYRLVGYENRVLAREDFDDDRKDAGDLGAGHSVTALYEIIPADPELAVEQPQELRYQHAGLTELGRTGQEWVTAKLRYKDPAGSLSRLLTASYAPPQVARRGSANLRFASAVAEFGLLLRGSGFRGTASVESVLSRAQLALGEDPEGYRAEFLELVSRYAQLARQYSREE